MLAYARWGGGAEPGPDRKGDHLVGDFYVLFDKKLSEEYDAGRRARPVGRKLDTWLETAKGRAALKAAEKDPDAPRPERVFFGGYKDDYFNNESALGHEVREMLRRWEDNDPAVRGLWRRMTTGCSPVSKTSYRPDGVGFDHVQVESETYMLGKALVEEGLARGLLRRLDDGAVVCDS